MKRRLEYRDKKSDKFWEIETAGSEHTVCYGKSGTAGRSLTKAFESADAARADAAKLIKQKLKKGYQDVVAGGGGAPAAAPAKKRAAAPRQKPTAPQKKATTVKKAAVPRKAAGDLPDVYKPLLKALKVMQAPPTKLHAGGPQARVLSGEERLATLLCERCMERTRHKTNPGDEAILAKLDKLRGRTGLKYEVLYPASNALPYGTDKAKREADAEESAAVQTTRAVLGCRYGSQMCLPYVTRALVRTVQELEQSEGPQVAAAFVVELDELILREEFVAAMVAKTKQQAPPFERVVWRGADAKKRPALWLVRLAEAETYGLLGKLGRRWAWTTGRRDDVLASVPDEHFEAAALALSAR